MRAGVYIPQPQGYRAFIPKPLPPDPPLSMDDELEYLLSQADQAVGRLDGITHVLANPDLFIAMYTTKEAVLSSQIEGTQSSLMDVLQYEATRGQKGLSVDVAEVINYINAMKYGLERVRTLPVSLRLIREIHSELMRGVRGADREPGEFRSSQNWIGPRGSTIETAEFIPPPSQEAIGAMGELEMFLYRRSKIPTLIVCGLVHCQFETIHPFLDGNGRVGRLLIPFLLCQLGVLSRPLLYVSYYFKENRDRYYKSLMCVRNEGDWEGWIKFFLRGIQEVSKEAVETSHRIIRLEQDHSGTIREKVRTRKARDLLGLLFTYPIISIAEGSRRLGVSYNTADRLISEFEKVGILGEITGGRRGRLFGYSRYLDLLRPGTDLPSGT